MKLYLLQHGEAVSKQEDPGRPLSERGVQDVQAVAALLGNAGIKVARVWHSGKRRAEQTADILAKVVLAGGRAEVVEGISPNDPVGEFATDADVWEEDTLVVGHLPFMSRLVSLLVTGDTDTELVQYQPGSLVCLERLDAELWVITGMLRPALLAETG
ncbi:MAG TPA: phosphohistidine phosphatase SixA [Gammaproteobacteria bacterium]|nr:phosphohistidine phosphatase SixA [Gammaproteobacteria bacterium]